MSVLVYQHRNPWQLSVEELFAALDEPLTPSKLERATSFSELAKLSVVGDAVPTVNLCSCTSLRWLAIDNAPTPTVSRKLDELRCFHFTRLSVLQLTQVDLKTFPDSVLDLGTLEVLSLRENGITRLPAALANCLPSLRALWVDGNALTQLHFEMGRATALEQLSLARNALRSLPATTRHLTRLEVLCLNNNVVSTLGSVVAGLKSLQTFEADDNPLGVVPHGVDLLPQLTTLSLRSVGIRQLRGDTLASLTRVEEFHLSGNQLSSISTSVVALTNLRQLSLSHNIFNVLPAIVFGLPCLKFLTLVCLGLSSLPTEVGSATQLEAVTAWSNYLTALPSGICRLTNLKTLELRKNCIRTLPDLAGSMTRLNRIQVAENELRRLPNSFSMLTNLEGLLHLNRNGLISLPPVRTLVRVTDFRIKLNRMQCLPDDICVLIQLEAIWGCENELTSIPACLGKLTRLKLLYLHSNGITAIPSELARLTGVQEMFLDANRLCSLPAELGRLSSVRELRLNFNPLSSLPEFASLTNLRSVRLSVEQPLTEICRSFGSLTRCSLEFVPVDQRSLFTKSRLLAYMHAHGIAHKVLGTFAAIIDFVEGGFQTMVAPYVLVIDLDDMTFPNDLLHLEHLGFSALLDSSLLLRCFVQNSAWPTHKKLVAMPLGPHPGIDEVVRVPCSSGEAFEIALGVALQRGGAYLDRVFAIARKEAQFSPDRRNVTSANFNFLNSSYYLKRRGQVNEDRRDIELRLRGNPAVVFQESRVPFVEMLAFQAKSTFVLSVPGTGLDCYRTWESLYAGNFVVVPRTILAEELYDALPVLTLDSWDELTSQVLEDAAQSIAQRGWDVENGLSRMHLGYYLGCLHASKG